jgi:hypothetical protein
VLGCLLFNRLSRAPNGTLTYYHSLVRVKSMIFTGESKKEGSILIQATKTLKGYLEMHVYRYKQTKASKMKRKFLALVVVVF